MPQASLHLSLALVLQRRLHLRCLPFDADPEFRQKLVDAGTRLGKAAQYRSAGTIEFLVDQDTHKFYFLEVNTRLQVSFSLCSSAKHHSCKSYSALQTDG